MNYNYTNTYNNKYITTTTTMHVGINKLKSFLLRTHFAFQLSITIRNTTYFHTEWMMRGQEGLLSCYAAWNVQLVPSSAITRAPSPLPPLQSSLPSSSSSLPPLSFIVMEYFYFNPFEAPFSFAFNSWRGKQNKGLKVKSGCMNTNVGECAY